MVMGVLGSPHFTRILVDDHVQSEQMTFNDRFQLISVFRGGVSNQCCLGVCCQFYPGGGGHPILFFYCCRCHGVAGSCHHPVVGNWQEQVSVYRGGLTSVCVFCMSSPDRCRHALVLQAPEGAGVKGTKEDQLPCGHRLSGGHGTLAA